jgi:hypothetical protein
MRGTTAAQLLTAPAQGAMIALVYLGFTASSNLEPFHLARGVTTAGAAVQKV